MTADAMTPSPQGSAARLLAALQGDAEADAVAERIERGILAARDEMSAASDRDASSQLAEALAEWAARCEDDAAACRALQHAGDLSHDAQDNDLACEYYERALRRDPSDAGAMGKLQHLLTETQDWERLETARLTQVEALAERAPWEYELRVKALCSLAELRAKELGDIDTAIHAYQSALEIDPLDTATLALAELYLRRGHASDRDDAAELFFKLAEHAEPERASPLLERALDASPGHEGALAALQQLSELADDAHTDARLMRRMHTYVSVAPASPHRDSIAKLLDVHAEELPKEEGSVVSRASWHPVGTPPARPASQPPERQFVGAVPPTSGATRPFPILTRRTPEDAPGSAPGSPEERPVAITPQAAIGSTMPGGAPTARPAGLPRWTWPALIAATAIIAVVSLWPSREPSATAKDAAHASQAPAPAAAASDEAPRAPDARQPKPAAEGTPSAAPAELEAAPTAALSPGVSLVVPMLRLPLHLGDQRAEVVKALEPVQHRLQRCYANAQAKAKASRLEGLLEYGVLLRQGRVEKVRILADSLRSGAVRTCGVRALRSAPLSTREPRVSGQVRVVFDFAG